MNQNDTQSTAAPPEPVMKGATVKRQCEIDANRPALSNDTAGDHHPSAWGRGFAPEDGHPPLLAGEFNGSQRSVALLKAFGSSCMTESAIQPYATPVEQDGADALSGKSRATISTTRARDERSSVLTAGPTHLIRNAMHHVRKHKIPRWGWLSPRDLCKLTAYSQDRSSVAGQTLTDFQDCTNRRIVR